MKHYVLFFEGRHTCAKTFPSEAAARRFAEGWVNNYAIGEVRNIRRFKKGKSTKEKST